MAIQYKTHLKNYNEVRRALDVGIAELDDASKRIVILGGKIIERNAKQNFRGRPKGSAKVRAGRKVFLSTGQYQSKKTGEVFDFAPTPGRPTNRSGNLSASIHTEARRVGPGRWSSSTGGTTKYARAIELGSPRWKTGNKFPYLAPAYEQSIESLKTLYREEWGRVLR